MESVKITRVAAGATRTAFEETTVTLAEAQMAPLTQQKKMTAATRHPGFCSITNSNKRVHHPGVETSDTL